jgi:hypothetical protein
MNGMLLNSSTNSHIAVPPMPDLLGGAFSSFKQNVFDKFTRTPPAVDTSAASTYHLMLLYSPTLMMSNRQSFCKTRSVDAGQCLDRFSSYLAQDTDERAALGRVLQRGLLHTSNSGISTPPRWLWWIWRRDGTLRRRANNLRYKP